MLTTKVLVRKILLICLVLMASAVLYAGPVNPISYSMPNGDTGSYDYRDNSYPGCPCPTGAALSGGLGKLTDGVITTTSWNQPPNSSPGPERYVGWTIDPVITFFFGGTVNIDTIGLHVDNSFGAGGVSLPKNFHVVMGATTVDFPIADDTVNSAPRWYTFTGLNLSGSSLQLTVNRRNRWAMMDEVTFAGPGAAVPEPGSILLTGLGAACLILLRRLLTRDIKMPVHNC